MKTFKEKLINAYKYNFDTSDEELEKYRNITEDNAKSLYYDLQRNLKGQNNDTRLYRDGAFVGYATDDSHVIKHVMG